MLCDSVLCEFSKHQIMSISNSNAETSAWRRFAFIFLFSYCLLYIASVQFFPTFVMEPIWRAVVPWFAKLIGYEKEITVFTNGSGDTTYNYFQVLLFFVLAAVVSCTLTWSRKILPDHKVLYKWLTLFLRYYIAAQMLGYGLAKIFYLQFRYPSTVQLDQPLGDFSPMGLLWNFMGYSETYTVFTGILEFVGGAFLLFRRTTLLGALVTFGVMSNVMMLNFSYDVPVKLLSSHLVFMSLILICFNGRRLIRFFIKGQSTEAYALEGVVPARLEGGKNLAKGLFLSLGILLMISGRYAMRKKINDQTIKSEFVGRYIIQSAQVEGVDLDWYDISFSSGGHTQVTTTRDSVIEFQHRYIPGESSLEIKAFDEEVFQPIRFEKTDSIHYNLEGVYEGKLLKMEIEDTKKRYLLSDRGFHWIQEYPFNR